MQSDIREQEPLKFDVFHPEDAEGIGELFRSVYGEGYPVKLVYDPVALIKAFERKENIPLVARTKDGKIVAHEALYRSAPNPRVYEAGQGLVTTALRSSGISKKMNEYVCDVAVPGFNMEAIFGEAVCNHIYMQKSWSKFHTVETAIEVDLMPQEAYTAEGSATGRVATLLMFRNYREREQVIYVPDVYAEQLRFIYDGFPDEAHNFQTGNTILPLEPSRIEAQFFDFAKVTRLAVVESGIDFEAVLSGEERKAIDRGMVVLQIWIKLSWPFVNVVVEILRKHGYFFGGLLPRWFGTDGLLMQRIMQPPHWEGIHLFSDRAKKILDFVRTDWSRTRNTFL